MEIFRKELKPLVDGADNINMTSNLVNILIDLNESIENKAPPIYMIMIVHTKVHPNILIIFDLPLASSSS